MKVLHVIAEMGVGGAEAVVLSLAEDALARGDEVVIASSGGWRADALEALGARLVTVPMRGRDPRSLISAVLALRRAASQERPDLVHVHNVKVAALIRAAGVARKRLPTVVTFHGVPPAETLAASRVLLRSADVIVAVSADLRDRLVAAGCPADSVRVIENAVRPYELPPREQARSELGLPPDSPVVLCLARLAPPKRHDLLLTAWRHVPADAVLLLAGDGPNRTAVETVAADYSGRVRVLGARQDVGTLLAAADVNVLPSDSEGLPISVLEALAAGVPSVVSAIGGLADALPGAAQLVVPGSADALAAGIGDLLSDPALRHRLATAGRALVEQRYGLDRMLAVYRTLYAELADPQRRSLPGH